MFKDWACLLADVSEWTKRLKRKWNKVKNRHKCALLHQCLTQGSSIPDPPALYCYWAQGSPEASGSRSEAVNSALSSGTAIVSLITCSAGLSVIHCQAMWLSTHSNNVSAFLKGLQFTGVPRHRGLRTTGLGTSVDSDSERCLPMSVGRSNCQPAISLLNPAISQLHASFLTKLARLFSKREHDWSAVLSWNKCSVHKYAYRLWISLPPFHISSALCQSSFCLCCYYPP